MPVPDDQSPRRRRVVVTAASVSLVAALLALAAGVAYARFSASKPTNTETMAGGKVTLSSSSTATCTVTGLLPGHSAGPCTLQATYGGTVQGWMALDVLVATKAQSPGTIALYRPSDSANDLQLSVQDNQSPQVTYATPSTNFGAALSSCPAGSGFGSTYTCYQLTDLLVSTTAFTSSSAAVTFTLTATLPSSNGTGYQGGTASIVLLAHAAQAGNNAATGCTTAGQPCASIHWS